MGKITSGRPRKRCIDEIIATAGCYYLAGKTGFLRLLVIKKAYYYIISISLKAAPALALISAPSSAAPGRPRRSLYPWAGAGSRPSLYISVGWSSPSMDPRDIGVDIDASPASHLMDEGMGWRRDETAREN
ncbi:hypothetical protein EVAR_47009_1 [Eumeta japonica]|uniref:Uncharacterized protein n=1 Tax=Eumeta variegata TaxID=151549 RepID=A0A4C1XHC0_EUMVA|nr:hypothetical protein EVAR_47009_1 [Eumeta japonica]